LADGGVIVTVTVAQSLTDTLDPPPLMSQVKLPLHTEVGQGDKDTVPAPIAVKENPDPYKQHPVVDKTISWFAQGIMQAGSVPGAPP